MIVFRHCCLSVCLFCLAVASCSLVHAELPNPVLHSIFPAGGQAGTSFDVTVSGDGLEGLSSARCSHESIVFQKGENATLKVFIGPDTPAGIYDVQAVCANGLSSTRAFFVTNRNHVVESKPSEPAGAVQQVAMDSVISGRIEKKGEVDQYRFTAKQGQHVVVECWAERIDSRLRAVLELFDARGVRVAVSRGFFGLDSLIHFPIPADGEYAVRLHDLVYTGSGDHFYRLDVSASPRVLFTVPAVVQRGTKTPVALYGWNLSPTSISVAGADEIQDATKHDAARWLARGPGSLDKCVVQITAPEKPLRVPVHLHPAQIAIDGFAYYFPGADVPIQLTQTEVAVFAGEGENHSAGAARPVEFPCEISGQLIATNQRDWYSIQVRRGEVLHLEAFGQRIGSPVDLDVSVFDAAGERELASFHDELANIGGVRFSSRHLDPVGRWVAPADGRYLIMIRNLIGGLTADPRRVYQLSLRREEPDVQLAAVARRADSPAGINVRRGGREMVDVLAFRRRGFNGPIRITAENLPPGVRCPDIWLGPGVNRAPLILSAAENAPPFVGTLDLTGQIDLGGVELVREVRGGGMVCAGVPNGSGRLTLDIPWSVAGESPLLVTATCDRTRFSQGSIIDIEIDIQRRHAEHTASVKLYGVGLPESVGNQIAMIEAGEGTGIVSFYLPATLPAGRYSIAVRAETTVPDPADSDAKTPKSVSLTAFSNPITLDVYPAPFILEVDLDAPGKVQRGKYVRLKYTAKRKNGFISKIHTTLAAPRKVIGLRARGVTFVGQTESGILQIIANEDAPLGSQPFLRLEAVGTVEDKPIFLGSCFLELEIVR